jgi:serine/threonine protein kinase
MSNNQSGTLGKYQIIREIARSNDIVYEAYDPLMNRRVALKELALPPGATAQQREERVKRFLREARAAGTLAHPNIMTVYEAGEADGRHYIAMEYLDGHTLRNEIDTRGFLPLEKVYEIAEKVLTALDFAHKQGVIHRDIKPENIQLLSDGRIKLTDFGIARLTFEPNLTMDGQVFGTPSYMSPEQVVGREIDARSDLFSTGVVVYEMSSGQKPFSGDSVVSITYAIMNKEPDRPAQVNFALWQVLQRALDKSPQLRYPTAKDMDSALKAADQAARNGPVIDPQAPNAGVNRPHLQQAQQQQQNPYGQNVRSPYQQNYFYTPPAQPQPQQQQAPIYGNLPAPPVNVPYNPYQPAPQAPGAAPPVIPGAPFVGQQVPIYYPPPPRPPLMKPETRVFLGRLFVSLLVMGTLLALIIVGVNSISIAMQRAKLQTEDTSTVNLINSQDQNKPIAARIKEREDVLIPRLQSRESVEEQKRQLAVLYQQLARQQSEQNKPVEAEASLEKARELDSENPAYLSSLGKLYADQAARTQDWDTKIRLWELSADNWKEAAKRESDKNKAQTYSEGAAQAMYKQADDLVGMSMDNAEKARVLLWDALALTAADSPTRAAIDRKLRDLGRP